MQKFRKKPVVIEAMQLTVHTFTRRHPNPEHFPGVVYDPVAMKAYIQTLEGTMTASLGDWIIRGVQGELYPCKPDIFEATYEPVEALTQQPRYNPEMVEKLHKLKDEKPVAYFHDADALVDFLEQPFPPLDETEPTRVLAEDELARLLAKGGDP